MNINKMLLSKNKYSRPGIYMDKIKGIVIHYVGNPNTSAEANRNYFENLKYGTNNIYASSHYIIGIDGEIIMCVPEGEVAYHASKANYEYIGIECCHKYSDGKFSHKTINSLVMLCKDIISRYGNMDIIRHYDVTGKNCPLYYVKNTDEWKNILKLIEEDKMTTDEAVAVLKKNLRLEDSTIQFLLCYKFGDELVKRIAQNIK
ncbi:hypothetical protein B5E58_01270 [Tyzzerella sp. An114]|uniref:peptidoglycan recognition protein family protein n=1 Tax=Tyzzerella sp. An114 TaxID=1965545 RepID=UPI000B43609F|nr:peptidoglycan recognition family protein [Tyzzerella sp. An114]OUQ60530.1 hypothetical protein B5E58_01270 [Tyzzerella sp. An114]